MTLPLPGDGSMNLPGTGPMNVPGNVSGAGPANPCGQALNLIDEARDPAVTFVRLSQIRVELQSMNCAACVGALDTEVKFRSMLTTNLHTDMPSPQLATRITETLAKIDLSQLDVNDIDF